MRFEGKTSFFNLQHTKVGMTNMMSFTKLTELNMMSLQIIYNLLKVKGQRQSSIGSSAQEWVNVETFGDVGLQDLDAAGNEISDWDRYAAEEYDLLIAEEGGTDQDEM